MERSGSSLEFGIRMRAMRDAVKLTARSVAIWLRCSESLIYSIEGGYRTLDPESLSGLLIGPFKRPDMVPYMRKLLHEVAKGTDRPIRDEPTMHPNVMIVHELEPRSTSAYGMIIDQIPKLCQLPDYMRAQHRMAGLSNEEIEGLTKAGISRQERFFAMAKPPHTSIIITEGALARGLNIAGQMSHLAECAGHNALTIYLLTNDSGPQPSFSSFTVMYFDELPGILWSDGPSGGTLSHKSGDVNKAKELWDNLSKVAISPAKTLELIRSHC